MRNRIKKLLSLALVLCSLISVSIFPAKAADDSVLAETSLYLLKDTYIYDVSVETTLASFVSNIKNSVSVYTAAGKDATSADAISTGCYFNMNSKKYTVIVTGDIDGNSIIDSTDYLRVKAYFLGTKTLDDTQFKAADIDNSNKIDSTDYLKIKSSFVGTYLLPSSKEYMSRKALVSDIVSASNFLTSLNELDASFSLATTSNIESLNLKGSLLANKVGTEKPDFSFKVDANSSGVSLPISETHYYNGTLYTVNNGKKYMVKSSYADVSEFLSKYVAVSPVDSEGDFIILPKINREKILGEDYVTISSILKSIALGAEGGQLKYTFKTDNILHTNLFYEMFMQSTLASSFGNMNIRDIFDSIIADGTVYVNTSGMLTKSKIALDITVKDSAIIKLGVGTPKQLNVVFDIEFKNIGGVVSIAAPNASEYVTIDNIYTQYAFSAYNKVYGIASAVSSQYKETLTFDKSSVFVDMTTNVKNVEGGVELSRKTSTTGLVTSTEDLYIGNSKHVVSTNGNKTVTALDTSTLSVDKMGLFATPHYESVGNISDLDDFALKENTNSYTLDYTLTKDYALSLIRNSVAYPNLSSKLSSYTSSQFTVKSATGTITYSKDTFEVMNHSVIVSLQLSTGSTVSYSFSFETKSTDYTSVSIDKTLA